MSATKKNLFVAYTPYHVFISMVMAYSSEKNLNLNSLIIVGNFYQARTLYEALTQLDDSPFVNVNFFEGEHEIQNRNAFSRAFMRYLGVPLLCHKIIDCVRVVKPDIVYLFNEERAYSNSILEAAGKLGYSVDFVEDGANTYNSDTNNKPPAYLFWGKVFYGSSWKNVPVMGTHSIFKNVWVFFPRFVRNELLNKKINPIPLNGIDQLFNRRVDVSLLRHYSFDTIRFADVKCIILVSHSSVFKRFKDYESNTLGLIHKMLEAGWNIAIKYHPRDGDNDFLKLKDNPKIFMLKSSIPLEFIFLSMREKSPVIVGDLSTTLLMAHLMIKNARIFSMARLMGAKDERFIGMLEQLGVLLPKNEDEFNIHINSIV